MILPLKTTFGSPASADPPRHTSTAHEMKSVRRLIVLNGTRSASLKFTYRGSDGCAPGPRDRERPDRRSVPRSRRHDAQARDTAEQRPACHEVHRDDVE